MSLFQKSVIQKYLNNLDDSIIQDAYKRFQDFYGDKERIENIKLLKEENYQEGFLREIFVDVLGYKINPDKNYNLTTEFKNLTDSGKADGAILLDGKAIGVIELKSTKTTDLESIKKQAFSYKNNQPDCRYVITSNFEKLRFYIDNATEYEEFNLFKLSPEQFTFLYLILSKESIFSGLPDKLKDESRLHEESVSDKLYKDYSSFKRNVFNNLVKNNPQHDKLFLFHKSQKLLDRLLFVLFAEDRGLIPPNAISKIIDQWEKFAELDEPVSLYSRFVKLFHHLDEGHKYPSYELPAYNGGLYREDEILDSLIIDDDILHKDTLKLSTYDFNTEIDVNILGHIFEHSINEIEELTAELEGKEASKNKSKRKKEGIFYTPKFITKYIVENTVGALCEEKKKELKIEEIETEIIKNNRTTKGKLTKKAEELLKRLEAYRNYLISLKILDPACGSGAFLNQALEFLINEHEMIDSYRKELEKDQLGLYDISKSILENNLYGVDINEEAVEIAKLSLWLRTAEKGRKLSELSNNIKCGNSLIDDPEVAGDKAFKWEEEFKEIMVNGGFDVVIGNPPYVVLAPEELKDYKFIKGNNNTYVAFVEKGLELLRKCGELGFIIPDTWFGGDNFKDFREELIEKYDLKELIQLPYDIFLAYIDTSIVHIRKAKNNYITLFYKYDIRDNQDTINISQLISFPNKEWIKFGKIFLDKDILSIGEKVWFSKNNVKLEDISKINRGCLPPKGNEKSNVTNQYYNIKWFDHQVFRYLIVENSNKDCYVNYESLRENKPISLYQAEKLIARQLMSRQFRMNVTYLNEPFAFKKNLYAIYNLHVDYFYLYILSILNSQLFSFLQVNFNTSLQRDDFPAFSLNDFRNFPIANIEKNEQTKFVVNAENMLSLHKQLQEKINTFLSRLQANFPIEKLSNKLKEFYKYDFKTFLTELKKKKITLTLKQQDEWEPYFNEYKSELNSLQEEINKTDNEIDQLVYQLYGLTDEEKKIVEESVK